MNNFSLNKKADYLFLITILFITWINYLDLSLFSEDYLVLSFQKDINISNIFNIFFIKNVDGAYWRPFTYFSYRLVELISPNNVLLHRLCNFFIYSFVIVLLYDFLSKLSFNRNIALLSTALFSTIYSHDLQLAWIPGRTDTLMTMFILLNSVQLIKYFSTNDAKYLLFASIFFIFGVLSKEHAIIAICLPFLILYYQNTISFRKIIYPTLSYLLIALSLFLYRIYIIGGSPFSSSNFEEINILNIFKNYFIYYFLAFFRPEELESLFYFFKINILILIFTLIMFVFLIFSLRKQLFLTIKSRNFKLGLLWFSVMIFPALPYLMRWYPFLPSIGLIIIIATFLEKIKIKYSAIIVIVVIFFNFLFVQINYKHWHYASKKSEIIKIKLHSVSPEYTKVRFWALPDKFNRINMYKIAPNVFFSDLLDLNQDSILSPIRCEYYTDSEFKINRSDSTFKVILTNGRLFPRATKSSSILKYEDYKIINNDFIANISTHNAYGKFYSELSVQLIKKTNVKDLFFNGVYFVDEKNITQNKASIKK